MPIEKGEVYVCARCGHRWLPRGKKKPAACAKCKSEAWDKPKK